MLAQKENRANKGRDSNKFEIPQLTILRVLQRHLVMRTYTMYMIRVLYAGNRAKLVKFTDAILRDVEDNKFLPRLNLNGLMKPYFLSAAKLSSPYQNIGIQKSPHTMILTHHRGSPEVYVFCAVSLRKVLGFSLARKK